MTLWKTFALTFRGRLHTKEGGSCQDSVYSHSSKDYAVVALSDGAGSASLSHIGSKITVNTFANYLKANFDDLYEEEDGHLRVIERINRNLKRHAQRTNAPLREYSSTLIGVAIKDNRFFFMHIGDGVAGFEDQEGIKVLSTGAQGEFINETYFVTSPNAKEVAIVRKGEISEGVISFFVMSDGASRILYDNRKNRFTPGMVKILGWLDKYEKSQLKKTLIKSLGRLPPHYVYDDFSLGIMRRV